MVVGRETPAMCLSDGYDSGGIALSLGKLEIQTAMYTVQAREDVTVLVERFFHLRTRELIAKFSDIKVLIRKWSANMPYTALAAPLVGSQGPPNRRKEAWDERHLEAHSALHRELRTREDFPQRGGRTSAAAWHPKSVWDDVTGCGTPRWL